MHHLETWCAFILILSHVWQGFPKRQINKPLEDTYKTTEGSYFLLLLVLQQRSKLSEYQQTHKEQPQNKRLS